MKKISKQFCGAGKSACLIPDFIFTASCSKHDDYYKKGGGIIEKVKADTFFYAYMLDDISKGNYKFIRKMCYFKLASFYFVVVSIFGIFFFKWRYKSTFISNWKFKK